MDIMNLQIPVAEKPQGAAFAKRNTAKERTPQKKTDNFSSTFDKAIERSAPKNSPSDTAKVSKDAEKPIDSDNENRIINQTKSPVSTENNPEDALQPTKEPQAEPDGKPEISGEFLNTVMPLIAQMSPVAAIADGNVNAGQNNELPLNLSKRTMIPPGMGEIKDNLLLDPKIVQELLGGANAQNKGRGVLQGTVNEILSAAKQDANLLTSEGELSKLTKAELEVFLRQANNAAKQTQPGIPNPTSVSELAKPGGEQPQSIPEMPRPNPEQPKVNMEQLKANAEQFKVTAEQLKTNAEQPALNEQQPKLNPESIKTNPESIKVNPESIKSNPELIKTNSELIKTNPELIKTNPELIKANPEIPKQTNDAVKPVVEIAKLTVVDTPKPLQATLLKPNEQPVAGEINNSPQMAKENPEQNFGSRQNNTGQQSFSQTMESTLGQMKNNAEPTPNNTPAFAVSQDTAPSNFSEKPAATQLQQPAHDSLNPRDDFQIKNQIVQHALLINRSAQESEMIIRLKPEHLGELALKVTVNNGVINASFHTNNAEVRGILENSLQQLKNDLANAGFKVDNVSISAGLNQFNSEQERALNWQQERLKRVSGKNGEAGYQETIEDNLANQQIINSSQDDGVDYRI